MAWNMQEDTHAFTYSIELCDDYLVRISVPDYEITDGAYVLSDVNILEDQIYDMLTVNGSEFHVRDNVRGKSVHLVRVTEEGEKEIRTFEVRFGGIEPEDVSLTGVEDLMGYPAFYVDQYEDFDFLHVNYYYGVTDATVVELGEGFGNEPSENNFIVDVNDDGEMELICCLEYRADGGHEVRIYFQQDGQTELKYQEYEATPDNLKNIYEYPATK